jgi:hypothetical protein
MRYKIQSESTFGWGDIRQSVDGLGKYEDCHYETKELADEECSELNEKLGGGFRVVPITTRSDFDFY